MINVMAVGVVTQLLILSLVLWRRVQALRGDLHDLRQIADVQVKLLAISDQELDACKDALSSERRISAHELTAERRTSETLRAALRQAHADCGACKADCARAYAVYCQN